MDVRHKVGVLGVRPQSAQRPGTLSTVASEAASGGTRADRQAVATQLWDKWAVEALGPMSADPTHEELTAQSRRVRRLEQDCAALAARAQRRLELSAAIRSQPVYLGGTGKTGPASPGGQPQLQTGSFNREMQYALRERRKAAAYAAVKVEGEAEAEGGSAAGAASTAGAHASGSGAMGRSPSFKSRMMLDALIASRASGSGSAGGFGEAGGQSRSSARTRPHSAMPGSGGRGAAGSASVGRTRPRSAVQGALGSAPGSPKHPASMARRAAGLAAAGAAVSGGMPAGSGSYSGLGMGPVALPGSGVVVLPEGEYAALRQEMEVVSERLAATQAALEVQTDTESQLREAVDMLRARLHSSGLREVEAQRRLAQHSKLEPLFDRLGEMFTFSSPEEVVARLEFLEDDKLGTFDQLLRTQEEVTRLQQRLLEVQKAGETVATRLTTDALQGSARLQEQNEQLRQELESMENLVHRLTSRQAQLVALQTAVLQLWGKCSEDPQFSAAFTAGASSTSGSVAAGGPTSTRRSIALTARDRPSSPAAASEAPGSVLGSSTGRPGSSLGQADGGGGGGTDLADPLTMLHMIEEFVMGKSDKLSIKHFTDIQRVANHVWQQHFKHRADIRGKVVPTFEQLSKIADGMAKKIHSVRDEAGRSADAEKHLAKQVRKLQQQKKALEDELARRDDMVRSLMGVPRRERPASAAAALERILRGDAAATERADSTWGGMTGPGAGISRAMSTVSGVARSTVTAVTGPPASRMSTAGQGRDGGGYGTAGLGSRVSQGGMSAAETRKVRPVSAPNGAAAAAARAYGGAGGGGPQRASAAPTTTGGTLAYALSPALVATLPHPYADIPAGAHWRQHVSHAGTAGARAPASKPPPGGLFYTVPAGSLGGREQVGGQGGAAASGDGGQDEQSGKQGAGSAGVYVGSTPGGSGELVSAEAVKQAPPARWAAPQRSAIEQAFLTRLERRTRVS